MRRLKDDLRRYRHAVSARQTGARPSQERSRRAAAVSLGEKERSFIAARDSFYLASVNSDGWPCVQHRGGSRGFLKVTGPGSLAFADLSGNRRNIGVGNVEDDDRVSLFLMDRPGGRRLEVMGWGQVVELDDPAFPEEAADARARRAWIVDIAALARNCASRIAPRYTKEELALSFGRLVARIRDLEAQLELAAYTK